MAQPPLDTGAQHQPPPIFYCWKYWLSNGEVAEGCTAVDQVGDSKMPDLNMYGYLYILVPLLVLLLLLFLLYCCCKGTTKAPQDTQPLVVDDDDSSDLEDFGPALSAKPRSPLRSVVSNHYTSHPAMSDPRRMYTIVNMEGKPEKVPLSGGVSAMPRLYPRLSSMRKSNKKKNGVKSKTPSPTAPPASLVRMVPQQERVVQVVRDEDPVFDEQKHDTSSSDTSASEDEGEVKIPSESSHADEEKVASESEAEDEKKKEDSSSDSESDEEKTLLRKQPTEAV